MSLTTRISVFVAIAVGLGEQHVADAALSHAQLISSALGKSEGEAWVFKDEMMRTMWKNKQLERKNTELERKSDALQTQLNELKMRLSCLLLRPSPVSSVPPAPTSPADVRNAPYFFG